MTKAELRNTYKTKRKELTADQIEDLSLTIANQLLALPIWKHSFYHIYLSITEHREINTDYILNILSGKDKHIIVSKTHFDTMELSHFLLTDQTVIKKNSWNIPEPVDGIEIDPQKIDVVFIPLLAFDVRGNRVGYGKGFYDRFLSRCRPDTLKIGLSFFEAESIISDTTPNDVPLDFAVTPQRLYAFGRFSVNS